LTCGAGGPVGVALRSPPSGRLASWFSGGVDAAALGVPVTRIGTVATGTASFKVARGCRPGETISAATSGAEPDTIVEPTTRPGEPSRGVTDAGGSEVGERRRGSAPMEPRRGVAEGGLACTGGRL